MPSQSQIPGKKAVITSSLAMRNREPFSPFASKQKLQEDESSLPPPPPPRKEGDDDDQSEKKYNKEDPKKHKRPDKGKDKESVPSPSLTPSDPLLAPASRLAPSFTPRSAPAVHTTALFLSCHWTYLSTSFLFSSASTAISSQYCQSLHSSRNSAAQGSHRRVPA